MVAIIGDVRGESRDRARYIGRVRQRFQRALNLGSVDSRRNSNPPLEGERNATDFEGGAPTSDRIMYTYGYYR